MSITAPFLLFFPSWRQASIKSLTHAFSIKSNLQPLERDRVSATFTLPSVKCSGLGFSTTLSIFCLTDQFPGKAKDRFLAKLWIKWRFHLLCGPWVPKTQEGVVALQWEWLLWTEGRWHLPQRGDIGEKVDDNWERPESLTFWSFNLKPTMSKCLSSSKKQSW